MLLSILILPHKIMITTYNKISYFGSNFDWKSTLCYKMFYKKAIAYCPTCVIRSVLLTLFSIQKGEEMRQAIVLFAIVILFVICHVLRIVLNINEVVTYEENLASGKNNCLGFSYWSLITGAISHLLITVNSSTNFFIYCFMSTPFRTKFIAYTKKVSTLLTVGSYVGKGVRRS